MLSSTVSVLIHDETDDAYQLARTWLVVKKGLLISADQPI